MTVQRYDHFVAPQNFYRNIFKICGIPNEIFVKNAIFCMTNCHEDRDWQCICRKKIVVGVSAVITPLLVKAVMYCSTES